MTPGGPSELWDLLRARVGPAELRWLEDAVEDIRRDRSALAKLFPAVGRHVGRESLQPERDYGWTVDDAGRALLLLAVGDRVWGELDGLYRFGDAAERRAVLRSLSLLPPVDTADTGVRLVDDAIRSNDPRLIVAALGSYARDRLDEDAFNQAALKCVFVGVPLTALDGVVDRTSPSLSRMLAGYVLERVAAGRDVPPGIWPLIDAFPPNDLITAIEAELEHPVEARRTAAQAALAQRTGHRQTPAGQKSGTKQASRET